MNERAERYAELRRKLDRDANSTVTWAGMIVGMLMWINADEDEIQRAAATYQSVRGDT